MAKRIVHGEASRQAILRGVSALADAVKVTFDPRGRNVVIDGKFGSPLITKDGVTVAKEIELKNPMENMGAQMVKEGASKTSDVAGDGTTTATVLAQTIFREAVKTVAAGANPMAVKRGIERTVDVAVRQIKTLSKPVTGDMIAQVASISANSDSIIGNIIADAMKKVGKDALEEPLRLIASNAGHEGSIVAAKVRESSKPNYGFNAQTEQFTDMISARILDPAKVARSALQNAAFIASLMLTTEALVVDIAETNAVAMTDGPPSILNVR